MYVYCPQVCKEAAVNRAKTILATVGGIGFGLALFLVSRDQCMIVYYTYFVTMSTIIMQILPIAMSAYLITLYNAARRHEYESLGV